MYDNQKMLRRAAQKALSDQGYLVEVVKGSGGARLFVSKDGDRGLVQVRTSSDRWVGWMRKGGKWKGFDEAKLVVIAAIDNVQRPREVEVHAFSPPVVRDAFAANLAARERANAGFSKTAPVFIGLDPCLKGKPSSTSSDLKARAMWTARYPLDEAEHLDEVRAEAPPVARRPETREKFAARVRQEFADLIGVPAEAVSIDFRVSM